MKNLRLWSLVCALFCYSLLGSADQARPLHALPRPHGLPVYRLMPVPISDANPPEYVWLIEETTSGGPFTYKSLNAPGLLSWLSDLPKGAEIQYYSTSYPIPGYHGGQELLVFSRRCRQKGVVFSEQPVL